MAIDTKKIGEAPNGELSLGSIAGTEKLPLSGSKFIILDTLREWFAGIFTNKTTLDKLAELNGELTYNNVPLSKSGAPIIDKGSQSTSVTFSLSSDSRQYVNLTAGSIAVGFSNLPADFSTTTILDLSAVGIDVNLTFPGISSGVWVNGSALATIPNGKTYILTVTTKGSSVDNLIINYIEKGTPTGGSSSAGYKGDIQLSNGSGGFNAIEDSGFYSGNWRFINFGIPMNTLTDASSIIWDYTTGARKKLITSRSSITLSITNASIGAQGELYIYVANDINISAPHGYSDRGATPNEVYVKEWSGTISYITFKYTNTTYPCAGMILRFVKIAENDYHYQVSTIDSAPIPQ